MASKKSASKPATPKSDPSILRVADGENGVTKGMTQSEISANLSARSYLTAHAMRDYSGFDKSLLEVTDMMLELKKAGDEVVRGDLGRIERTLTSQFLTLDTIFANLAERSKRQEYMKQMETYLRLALKAQAQARATAEALAMLKNPQPYIKQANIANGQQQVNNMYANTSEHSGISERSQAHTRAHAGNSQSEPNKLLESQDVTTLDTRAPTPAVRANQTVEAVG